MKLRTGAGMLITVLVFGALLETAAQEKAKSPDSVYAELGKAPEKSRAKQNPLSKDPEARAAGEVLFEEHCVECHGEHGQGGKKAPSLQAAEVQEASDGALFWILTNGVVRKRMPVWSKLPEPQRWQLVTYIKSLGGEEVKKQGSKEVTK